MSTITCFKDIIVWQKGMKLSNGIYEVTKKGPFSKDFPLRDQIRRAAISIPANIAEGFERNGNRELQQFLSIAKGSSGEIMTFLLIARAQKYIDDDTFQQLNGLAEEVGKMIGGWIMYMKKKKFKGSKYNSLHDQRS